MVSVSPYSQQTGKVFRIGTVRYNWPMSAHASQAFSIAHCTDLEDLPQTEFSDHAYDIDIVACIGVILITNNYQQFTDNYYLQTTDEKL